MNFERQPIPPQEDEVDTTTAPVEDAPNPVVERDFSNVENLLQDVPEDTEKETNPEEGGNVSGELTKQERSEREEIQSLLDEGLKEDTAQGEIQDRLDKQFNDEQREQIRVEIQKSFEDEKTTPQETENVIPDVVEGLHPETEGESPESNPEKSSEQNPETPPKNEDGEEYDRINKLIKAEEKFVRGAKSTGRGIDKGIIGIAGVTMGFFGAIYKAFKFMNDERKRLNKFFSKVKNLFGFSKNKDKLEK